MSNSHFLLEVRNISKSFPGVQALSNVSFDLRRGEIHSIVGENGAGKSTLLSCINGLQRPDSGEVIINGRRVVIDTPAEAISHRLAMVHQELVLCPNLTVAENIYLGREPRLSGGRKDIEKMIRDAGALLDQLRVDIDPQTRVRMLSLNEQQIVEICRAIASDPEVIVFDEPTASLNDDQVEHLLEIITDLKTQGIGIVYVSHRLNEVLEISDRVTVLRDGNIVVTQPVEALSETEMVSLMVGRELKPDKSAYRARDLGPVVLELENVGYPGLFSDISFHVRKGEILGIAGLLGCRREAVVRAIFGAIPIETGNLKVHGAPLKLSSSREAIRNGIAFMPADRKQEGLNLSMTVAENMTMTVPEKVSWLGLLKNGEIIRLTREMIRELAVKVSSTQQRVSQLSGGNQQKIVIGKWITRDCDIVIAEDPTRGVDIGAKFEIWRVLQKLADDGRAVLLLTTELQEMMLACDRILVMSRGRVTGEFDRAEFSAEKIAHRFFM